MAYYDSQKPARDARGGVYDPPKNPSQRSSYDLDYNNEKKKASSEYMDLLLNARMPDISNKSRTTKFIVRAIVLFFFCYFVFGRNPGQSILVYLLILSLLIFIEVKKVSNERKWIEEQQRKQDDIFKRYQEEIEASLAGKKVSDLKPTKTEIKSYPEPISEKDVLIRQIGVFVGIAIILWIAYKIFH